MFDEEIHNLFTRTIVYIVAGVMTICRYVVPSSLSSRVTFDHRNHQGISNRTSCSFYMGTHLTVWNSLTDTPMDKTLLKAGRYNGRNVMTIINISPSVNNVNNVIASSQIFRLLNSDFTQCMFKAIRVLRNVEIITIPWIKSY